MAISEKMNITQAWTAKINAQNKIAEILYALEKETGCKVDSLYVKPTTVEYTAFGIPEEVESLTVEIKLVIA